MADQQGIVIVRRDGKYVAIVGHFDLDDSMQQSAIGTITWEEAIEVAETLDRGFQRAYSRGVYPAVAWVGKDPVRDLKDQLEKAEGVVTKIRERLAAMTGAQR